MALASLRMHLANAGQSIRDAEAEHQQSTTTDSHLDNAYVDLLDAVRNLQLACGELACGELACVVEEHPIARERQQEYSPKPPVQSGALPQLRQGLPRTLAEMEAEAIRDALARNDGNHRKSCLDLGLARSTFLRKLDELGLRVKDAKPRAEAAP